MNVLLKQSLKILAIVLVGLGLRLYGLDWDQGNHLHPDERFITMTSNDLKIPKDFLEYLDPVASPMNPFNSGQDVYVYGTLPLTLNKLIVTAIDKDTYDATTISGRVLSAIADSQTILMVFLIAGIMVRLHGLNPATPCLAAVLYAVAVLPIQLAHFFANDSFLCFFMTASCYFAMRFQEKTLKRDLCLSALFFGLALGTKVNAMFILPLLVWFLITRNRDSGQVVKSDSIRHFSMMVFRRAGLFVLIAYLSLRIADPRFFADGNLLNPQVNPRFIENLEMLSNISNPDSMYPPGIQWVDTPPVWFALKNMARYGLGYPLFGLMLLGAGRFAARRSGWRQWLDRIMILTWVLAFFLYQSTQYVKALRYFIFLYPFLAVFAAVGVTALAQIRPPALAKCVLAVTAVLVLIWPLAFMSIYARPHSRVAASRWIYDNVPSQSFLAGEHWDDQLPVKVPGMRKLKYRGTQMPVFTPDDKQKIDAMQEALRQADCIILSSNRGYGAIPKMPKKFPYMVSFYQKLFSNHRSFFKAAEFTSYPSINLGFVKWVFPDDDADETFTVYDHPKVTIFLRK